MHTDQLQTPALVLNIDATERNMRKMADECRAAGIALRPHTKGHKSPYLAHRQRALGAIGVCTAKIAEAEVMVAAGVDDVLVTTTLAPDKVDRLVSLASLASITCVIDHVDAATALSATAQARGVEVRVLVDVDVGQQRTGVDPSDAVELAAFIANLPGLRFSGVQGYEGHLQHVHELSSRQQMAHAAYNQLEEVRGALEDASLSAAWITTAGTGTYRHAIEHGTATEVQPGSYVVMDCKYSLVEELPFENALFVVSGVVSTSRKGTYILDAGWKALSTDDGNPTLRDRPEASYESAGDEHGCVSGLEGLRLGDQVWLIPSHCDTTINLHDRYIVVRDDGTVEGELPVAARGRLT